MKCVTRFFCTALLLGFFPAAFAAAEPASSGADQESLVQGYESYRRADWTSSMFFLRKAVTVPQNSTDETWYMLIMS